MMSSRDQQHDTDLYVDLDTLRRLRFQARGFSFLPNQPASSILNGKNVSKLRGRGLNFEELRHYRPGDDIRAMDWKTTKRTGKPHIKVYTEERERQVFLVVDQRSTLFFGSKGKLKSVVAAQLAALIAWRIEASGDRIGALVFSDDKSKVIPARRGGSHVIQMLSTIADFNQQLSASKRLPDAEQSLSQAYQKIPQIVGQNALVILVGDGYGWDAVSTEAIKKVSRHNDLIACNVIDPLEQKLPKMHHMVVSDGDQQIQFSSSDETIHKKYQDTLETQMQEYEQTARKYRIPFLTVDTLTPVATQLRKLMGGGY